MTLNLSLSPDLQERLHHEAERRGVSPGQVTVELLDKYVPHDERAAPTDVRRHDAFLSGYADDDEGLYDDLAPETVGSAEALLGKTPASQRVRLVGQLDAVVASTHQFSLLLDTGEKVIGVFSEEHADRMRQCWRARVLVLGTAIYSASGKLLRIDAEAVKPGERLADM